MPVYEVNIGRVLIKAKDEESAKFGACDYVATDLGIECLTATKIPYSREYDYEA